MKSKIAITRIQTLMIAIVIIVAGTIGGYYAWLMTTTEEPSQEEIKIGILSDLTGSWSTVGTSIKDGVMLCFDLQNEHGGVNGIQIKYVVADTKSDIPTAVAEAERLCTVEGVVAITGTMSSSTALAVQEVCENHKVLFWVACGCSSDITGRGYNYTFRVQPRCEDMGLVTLKMAKEIIAPKLGKTFEELKWGICHEDSSYGTSVTGVIKDALEGLGLGGNIVEYIPYDYKTEDLSWMVLRLKAAQPDFIVVGCYTPDAIMFLRQAKELGLEAPAFVSAGGGWNDPAVYEAVGSDLDYLFTTGAPGPKQIKREGYLPEFKPLADEWFTRYEQRYGKLPDAYAALGADAWPLVSHVMPLAMEKYGEVTAETCIKAAEEVDIPIGGTVLTFGVKFSTFEDPCASDLSREFGLNPPLVHDNLRAVLPVTQWFEGQLKIVWPEDFAGAEPVVPLPPESPYAP